MKKLYFSIVITVVGALFVLGWVLDAVFDAHTDNEHSNEIKLYRQIGHGISQQLIGDTSLGLEQQLDLLAQQFSLVLSLEAKQNIALPADMQSAMQQQGLVLDSDAGPYLLLPLLHNDRYYLQLFLPQKSDEPNQLNLILTLVLYASLCLVLILWLVPLTRRLSQLNRAALAFGNGDLSARVDTSQLSQIRLLEDSFNHMAGRIESLIAENKLLADSLSHDLRTPLACLRFGIDAALDEQNLDKKNHYINRLEEEITRMEAMLTAFLEFASIERQSSSLKFRQFDVVELLHNLADECQPLAANKPCQIKVVSEKANILVYADQHWLYRALLNLLTNAIRYTQDQVLLQVSSNNQQVEICVQDNGPGIPEIAWQQIFNPFTRLDKSRTREQGNFGLGLAIVSRIVQWHAATITVNNNDSGGACFKLTLTQKTPTI